MTNGEKYDDVFISTFGVTKEQLADLKYGEISFWDSVGHMSLIAAIESAFGVMLEGEDIIGLDSYSKGKEILSETKYGVVF